MKKIVLIVIYRKSSYTIFTHSVPNVVHIILTLNIRISILLVDRAGTNKTIKNKIEYEISVEIIFIENNSLLSKLIFSLLF